MSGGCKCRTIPVKRNLKIEADVVVSECAVCYCVVAQNSTYFTFYFERGCLGTWEVMGTVTDVALEQS